MPSLWRGRSSTTTITSRTSVPLRSATSRSSRPAGGRGRAGRPGARPPPSSPCTRTGPGRTSSRARTARSRRARSAGRRRPAACPRAGRPRCRPPAASPSPTCSPLWSIGASSFSPSPMTTMPSMDTVCSTACMPSTAAWSAASLSPWPTSRAADRAAASVTRTSSSARLRSTGVLIYMTPGGLRTRSVWPAAHRAADDHQDRSQQGAPEPQLRALIAPLGEPGRSSSPV